MSIDANTSVETLRSATVYSSDGDKIGSVGDVYLGDTSEQPEWVTVKTGLFGTAETFVPLADASVHGDEIRVPYSKDKVKDAPRTDADGQISEAEEDRLFTYYGVSGMSAVSGTGGQTGGDLGGAAAGLVNGRSDNRSDDRLGDEGDTRGSGRHTIDGDADGNVEGYVDGSGQDRSDYEQLDDLGAARGTAGPESAGSGVAGSDVAGSATNTPGAAGYAEGGVDSRRDRAGEPGVQGRDTSGPTTDEAMTRSEERLQVGTQRREAGRARLRKHIVTETQTAQVATSRDELTISREPITDANRGAATSGAELSEEEHEVVLHEEVPVVSKTIEAVERVRLGTETQHETQSVSADVRKEQIDLDRDGTRGGAGDDVFDVDADSARAAGKRDNRI